MKDTKSDWTLNEIGVELGKVAKELPPEDSEIAFSRLMHLLSTPVGGLGNKSGRV